ncbi:MAG: 30S ribosome-binding factor RbfA [Dehalococcoidales bacterium]|nr:30S ribosome-binding factor RbfA [Dehalococcoidales bacterium]MDZ4230487.1 30S ribosome-binding factor RbfA [Dehalococcoidales bacterium]
MPHRIERVNSLIRQELSQLLQRQVKDPRLGTFITVTEVITSADLKHARVFISRLGSEEEKRETLSVLASASGFLRKELAKNLKLRYTPELSFQWDESIERGDHLLQLLDAVTSDEDEALRTSGSGED